MGISSELAASRLIQPGVIASSSERPAAPYEGQCIYQKDTNQLLVWDGSAWVIPNQTTQNPEGLEFIKSQTVGSSVSSVTVSNVFSSTYNNYRIVVNNIQANTAGNEIRLTLGSNTSGYYYGGYTVTYGGTGAIINGSNTAYIPIAQTEYSAYGGEQGFSCDIFSPNISARSIVFATGFGLGTGRWVGGMDTNTTQHTAFTLTASANSWSGGTISVYGYRNS